MNRWRLKTKLHFIGSSGSKWVCALASVSRSFVIVVPKLMSCDLDLIVKAAEAVAMALASEDCCFMTEGGGKHTVQSDSSWKHPCLTAKPTQCDSYCARLHVYVSINVQKGFVSYQWPPPPFSLGFSFGPRPTRDSPRSKKRTKAPKTQWHQWSEWEWINTVDREVERSGERMRQSERRKKIHGCWGGGHKHQGNKRHWAKRIESVRLGRREWENTHTNTYTRTHVDTPATHPITDLTMKAKDPSWFMATDLTPGLVKTREVPTGPYLGTSWTITHR